MTTGLFFLFQALLLLAEAFLPGKVRPADGEAGGLPPLSPPSSPLPVPRSARGGAQPPACWKIVVADSGGTLPSQAASLRYANALRAAAGRVAMLAVV
ncbi:MAG: hypothetical protein WCY29_12160 [Novosphingobium sp.]